MADLPIDAIILEDNDRGVLWNNNGNETIQDAKKKFPDAAKFRRGGPYVKGQTGGGGADSYDVTDGLPPRRDGSAPPSRVEAVVVTAGMNEGGGGEWGLNILKQGSWSDIDDAAQIKVIEATSDQVEFKVPIKAPNLTGSDGGKRVYHEGGRFCTVFQNDGHQVTYDMTVNPWRPMWGNWEGLIVPLPWV